MGRVWLVVLAMMFLAVTGYCADEADVPGEFGAVVSGSMSMSVVVEQINYETREITLKNADGVVQTVIAGPLVRNFDQIQKGDKVNIDITETVKVIVSDKAATPERQEVVEVTGAPLGEKPAGVITQDMQILATVEAVDYDNRSVTLKGPQRTVVLVAEGNDPDFDKIKAGDTVYMQDTLQTAISVTK